jgi:hypothetical protein
MTPYEKQNIAKLAKLGYAQAIDTNTLLKEKKIKALEYYVRRSFDYNKGDIDMVRFEFMNIGDIFKDHGIEKYELKALANMTIKNIVVNRIVTSFEKTQCAATVISSLMAKMNNSVIRVKSSLSDHKDFYLDLNLTGELNKFFINFNHSRVEALAMKGEKRASFIKYLKKRNEQINHD